MKKSVLMVVALGCLAGCAADREPPGGIDGVFRGEIELPSTIALDEVRLGLFPHDGIYVDTDPARFSWVVGTLSDVVVAPLLMAEIGSDGAWSIDLRAEFDDSKEEFVLAAWHDTDGDLEMSIALEAGAGETAAAPTATLTDDTLARNEVEVTLATIHFDEKGGRWSGWPLQVMDENGSSSGVQLRDGDEDGWTITLP